MTHLPYIILVLRRVGTFHLYQNYELTEILAHLIYVVSGECSSSNKPSQLEGACGYLPVFSYMSSEISLSLSFFLDPASLSLEKSLEYQGL